MGHICPKNTFLQLKHYIQRIYVTLLSTTCVKIHQTPCHFLRHDFPLPELKFTKFLMSFFKQKVSFSSKCGSLFSVMRVNSSVLFHIKLYMLSTKGTHQVQIFRLSTARIKINHIPCHFSSHESVFP